MITLHASVVVAHLTPHDVHHVAASRYLSAASGDELVMHPLNVAEVLVGGVRAGRGPQLLADLGALGIRTAPAPPDEPMRLATLRVSTGLKMPDCCALDTAIATGSTLATFDGTLARAAHAAHVPVDVP